MGPWIETPIDGGVRIEINAAGGELDAPESPVGISERERFRLGMTATGTSVALLVTLAVVLFEESQPLAGVCCLGTSAVTFIVASVYLGRARAKLHEQGPETRAQKRYVLEVTFEGLFIRSTDEVAPRIHVPLRRIESIAHRSFHRLEVFERSGARFILPIRTYDNAMLADRLTRAAKEARMALGGYRGA